VNKSGSLLGISGNKRDESPRRAVVHLAAGAAALAAATSARAHSIPRSFGCDLNASKPLAAAFLNRSESSQKL
jgi:hypothetical protein